MPAWPGTVPQFVLRENYSEDFGQNLLRSSMDTGPAKRRRRFTAVPKTLNVMMVMTSAELDIFETFYNTTLGGGALSFTFTHPRTDVVESVAFVEPVRDVTPEGASTYFLSMKLEVLP